MKRVAMFACGLVATACMASPALALPVFKSAFEEYYNLKEPQTDAEKSLAAAVGEAKCNTCHKGKSKKERNAYGDELHKYLEKDNFKKERVTAEPAKVKEEIEAALKKAEEGAAAGGKTFGELLKAGQLAAPAE